MEPKGSQMELTWSQKGAGMEREPCQELFFSLYVGRARTPAAVTLLVKLLLSVARRQGTDTSSCNSASDAALYVGTARTPAAVTLLVKLLAARRLPSLYITCTFPFAPPT